MWAGHVHAVHTLWSRLPRPQRETIDPWGHDAEAQVRAAYRRAPTATLRALFARLRPRRITQALDEWAFRTRQLRHLEQHLTRLRDWHTHTARTVARQHALVETQEESRCGTLTAREARDAQRCAGLEARAPNEAAHLQTVQRELHDALRTVEHHGDGAVAARATAMAARLCRNRVQPAAARLAATVDAQAAAGRIRAAAAAAAARARAHRLAQRQAHAAEWARLRHEHAATEAALALDVARQRADLDALRAELPNVKG